MPAARSLAQENPVERSASRGQVAIIEDDVSALAALTSLVSALGWTALGFADPILFLASGMASEVVCLIADMRLPGMSGLALHHRLREEGIQVPTILVTAYPDEATRAGALAVGALAYLAKPVEPETLFTLLRMAETGGPPA